MRDELIVRKNLLFKWKYANFLKRINKFISFKFLTKKSLREYKKIIELNPSSNGIELIKIFFNWLTQKKEFFIIYDNFPEWHFILVKNDFTLLAEISLVNNDIPAKSLKDFSYLFELQYIVAVEDGHHVGTDFINSFISLSKQTNIPIHLYCSRDMVSFYERFDFKWLYRQIREGHEEWRMAYVPYTKPIHQKLPQFENIEK